jgi:hypothetical protein
MSFKAALDEDEAVLVHCAEIAGMHVAAAKRLGGFLRVVEIAGASGRGASDDLTELPRGGDRTIGSLDPDIRQRQRGANRIGVTFAVRWRADRQCAGFLHAIVFVNGGTQRCRRAKPQRESPVISA